MILASGHRQQRLAVGDRQHARFLAVQPLLDHELIARFAEFAFSSNAIDGFERLLTIVAHDHALAGREPVGLDHDRHIVAIFQIRLAQLGTLKDAVIGARHVGVAEQFLAENLAPFEFRGRLRRTKRP